MWTFIPNESCLSVLASGGSTKVCGLASNGSGATVALWLTLSGTATQRPCSWRGWLNRPWSTRLLATASTILASSSEAEWIGSWLDSPANRGAMPEASKAPPTNAGSGLTLRTVSDEWDREACFWRTSLDLFPGEGLNTSSYRLPKWGSMRNGVVSRRPAWEPVTDESECLLSQWTTPTAKHNARSEGQTSGRLDNGAGNACLATDAKQWATPRSSENENRTTKPAPSHGNGHGELLAAQVTQWATPSARDHKGIDLPSRSGGTSLAHQTQTGEFSHQAQPPTGKTYQNISGRRLNPAFVNWLMASPWFWTKAEPISCGAQATAAWRSRLRQHLWNLLKD